MYTQTGSLSIQFWMYTKSCEPTLKITIFLRFWGGTSPSDTPVPTGTKDMSVLNLGTPSFKKNYGSAPAETYEVLALIILILLGLLVIFIMLNDGRKWRNRCSVQYYSVYLLTIPSPSLVTKSSHCSCFIGLRLRTWFILVLQVKLRIQALIIHIWTLKKLLILSLTLYKDNIAGTQKHNLD